MSNASRVCDSENGEDVAVNCEDNYVVAEQRPPNQQLQVVRRPMNAFLIFCKRHRTSVKEAYSHLENRAVTKILGEWWAYLKESEKFCYTELATQYKEAYMKAHPDFRWYKMPATTSSTQGGHGNASYRQISARTCKLSPVSPIHNTSVSSSLSSSSPSSSTSCVTPQTQLFARGLIVPGKLADLKWLITSTPLLKMANSRNRFGSLNSERRTTGLDESQLGGLSSLIVPRCKPICVPNHSPPKPPKKRYLEENYPEQNSDSHERILNGSNGDCVDCYERAPNGFSEEKPPPKYSANGSDMGKEDRLRIWRNRLLWSLDGCKEERKQDVEVNNNGSGLSATTERDEEFEEEDEKAVVVTTVEEEEEERTSRRGGRARACKGRRYREFMNNAVINRRKSSSRFENSVQESTETPTSSIQLRRRCRNKSSDEKKTKEDVSNSSASTSVCGDVEETTIKQEHKEVSEIQDNDFNLDEKIHALPFLSIEDFQNKKRAKKKNGTLFGSSARIGSKAPLTRNRNQRPCLGEGRFVEKQEHLNCHDKNRVLLVNRAGTIACIDTQNNNVINEDTSLTCGPKCAENNIEIQNAVVVGSRKRKARRQDIRRLQPGTSFKDTSVVEVVAHENLGLFTLADVAAKKQKLIGK